MTDLDRGKKMNRLADIKGVAIIVDCEACEKATMETY
jgi:hypothetical protein